MELVSEKRKLTDDDISQFLSKSTRTYYSELDKAFNGDTIALMGYLATQIVDGVSGIVKLPSKFAVDEFKRTTSDKELLRSLTNPYTELALDLKQLYDSRLIPLFDSLLKFDKQNGALLALKDDVEHIQRNRTISEFFENSYAYIPDLPEIRDPVMFEAFFEKKPILFSTLVSVGKRNYEAISSIILSERFSDREIEEFTLFTEDIRVVDHWNLLYKEKILREEDDLIVPYYQNFYAFVGSLVKVNQFSDLKEWLTILLEPLIQQFILNEHASFKSVETLKEKLPEAKCEKIYSHKGNSGDDIYIVQFKYQSFVLGTGSSNTLDEAEARASENALHNSSLIKSISRFKHQEIENQQPSPLPFGANTHNINKIPGQIQISGSSYGETIPTNLNQPHNQSQNPSSYNGPIVANLNALVQPRALQIVQTEKEKTYDEDQIYEFPAPTDENLVSNSSKERLNALLLQKKLNTAEYKTSKISNSEVQVTCWISAKPIARTTATNKKKAGQYVAEKILEYFDHFMHENGIIRNPNYE